MFAGSDRGRLGLLASWPMLAIVWILIVFRFVVGEGLGTMDMSVARRLIGMVMN